MSFISWSIDHDVTFLPFPVAQALEFSVKNEV